MKVKGTFDAGIARTGAGCVSQQFRECLPEDRRVAQLEAKIWIALHRPSRLECPCPDRWLILNNDLLQANSLKGRPKINAASCKWGASFSQREKVPGKAGRMRGFNVSEKNSTLTPSQDVSANFRRPQPLTPVLRTDPLPLGEGLLLVDSLIR